MRRRVQRAVIAAVVIALIVFVLPLGIAVSALIEGNGDQDLERTALETAFRVGSTFAAGDPVELPASTGRDVGLYDTKGHLRTGRGPLRAEGVLLSVTRGRVVREDVNGVRILAVPVVRDEATIGVVRVAESGTDRVLTVAAAWTVLLAVAAIVAAASGVLARRTARQIAAPVEELAEDAQFLGDPDAQIPEGVAGIDEIDSLRAALRAASARIRNLVERERRISSNASHQLRTPLAGLRARLELAMDAPDSRALRAALADVDRMDATIGDLIALARRTPDASDESALETVLDQITDRWRDHLRRVGRELRMELADQVRWVPVPARAINLVLDVLIDNALQHGAGQVRLDADRVGSVLVLDVADDGHYDGPDDPFSEPTPRGDGRGIGLALARRVAEDAGARLLLAQAGAPTRFTLLLPMGEEPEPEPAAGGALGSGDGR